MLEHVVKVTYNLDLNSVLIRSRRVRSFFENMSQEVIDHFLRVVLKDAIPKDDSWAQLDYCLGSNSATSNFSISVDGHSIYGMEAISMIVFPHTGEIKEYVLNPESTFFSNVHQDSDPLLVTNIEEGITLHSRIVNDFLHFGRDSYVPNKIQSGLLFKKNIRQYEGFKEYLKYYEK